MNSTSNERYYFDLSEPLFLDTYFSMKIGNKFVHYIVHVNRLDGTKRLWGDVYHYFTDRLDFRFGIGYYLNESKDGLYWEGQKQYVYFSKEEPPYKEERLLKQPLFFPKGKKLYVSVWDSL